MIIIGLRYFFNMYRVYGFSKNVSLRGDADGLIIEGSVSMRINYVSWPRALEIKIEEKDRVAKVFSNLYIVITRRKIEDSFRKTLEDLFNDERIDDYTKQLRISEDECVRIIPQIGQTYYPPIAICKI